MQTTAQTINPVVQLCVGLKQQEGIVMNILSILLIILVITRHYSTTSKDVAIMARKAKP